MFAKRQRFQSAVKLSAGRRISTETMEKRLHRAILKACRPAVSPELELQHPRDRLNCATVHINQQHHWRSVLLSDKLQLCFNLHDGIKLVWRSKGKDMPIVAFLIMTNLKQGSVMILASISVDYKTGLSVHEGSLAALKYQDCRCL